MKLYALDMNKTEWTELLEKLGQPKFRADQLLQWMWEKHVFDVEEMTNLSKALREQLPEEVDFGAPLLVREQRSKDGTRKFLWQLRDGSTVESVLLKSGARLTACISTQVGCPLGCTFCATGLSGFVRNLSSGEIAGQFLAMEAQLGREISNIVYMGMGEPMLNKDEVFKSVRMLNDEKLRNIGIRRITISTSGIIPGIQALADEGLGTRLAVSLHAVDDELRSRLMPVNERFPLAELREAIKDYQEKTGDRVSIEYTLFGGVNDSVEHARALVRFLKGIHVFINLIPFNAVDERYDMPEAKDILKFKKVLDTAGFENELRREQGADIDAACGQLRRKDAEGTAVALEPRPHSVTKKDGRRPKQTADGTPPVTGRNRRVSQGAGTNETLKSAAGSGGRKAAKDSDGKQEKRVPRKKLLPEKERYRSGKLKEERPSYKKQLPVEDDFAGDKTGYGKSENRGRRTAVRIAKPQAKAEKNEKRPFYEAELHKRKTKQKPADKASSRKAKPKTKNAAKKRGAEK